MAGSENADLAAEVFAYIKLSETANEEVWNVLGFDPVNTALWTDTAITENPDNAFIQYFNTKPFDTLNELADGIGLLKCYTDEKMPSVTNTFCTVTLNDIFESDADVKTALDLSLIHIFWGRLLCDRVELFKFIIPVCADCSRIMDKICCAYKMHAGLIYRVRRRDQISAVD